MNPSKNIIFYIIIRSAFYFSPQNTGIFLLLSTISSCHNKLSWTYFHSANHTLISSVYNEFSRACFYEPIRTNPHEPIRASLQINQSDLTSVHYVLLCLASMRDWECFYQPIRTNQQEPIRARLQLDQSDLTSVHCIFCVLHPWEIENVSINQSELTHTSQSEPVFNLTNQISPLYIVLGCVLLHPWETENGSNATAIQTPHKWCQPGVQCQWEYIGSANTNLSNAELSGTETEKTP